MSLCWYTIPPPLPFEFGGDEMNALDVLQASYEAEIAVSQKQAQDIANAPEELRALLAPPPLVEPYPTFEQWLARQSFMSGFAPRSFERARHHAKGHGWKANHEGSV